MSSGATLEANGLREVEVVYRSKACLIAKSEPLDADQGGPGREASRAHAGRLKGPRMQVHHAARPEGEARRSNGASAGAEHPTILPLAGSDDHVALHMVSSESLFWETMEELKALGRQLDSRPAD